MAAIAADTTTPQALWDVAALAQRLGVTERFVRRLVPERRVPFYKIGKFIRFDPDRIYAWLASTEMDSRVCPTKSAGARLPSTRSLPA